MTTSTPRRALVIAAHPDDIEFGAAGTIANWTDAGAQVIYCMVTNGAAGSNKPGEDLQALIRQRQDEQCQAAALVGVQDVRFLGHADGALQATMELRRELTRLIREIRPDVVMCQDPTLILAGDFYINHPDHRAAGEAALYAVFPSAGTRPIFPELLAEGFEPHDVNELWLLFPERHNTVIDVTPQIERKLQSLLCHKSQLGPEVGDMVRGWDRETGKASGFGYAETFKVMKLRRDPPPPENGS